MAARLRNHTQITGHKCPGRRTSITEQMPNRSGRIFDVAFAASPYNRPESARLRMSTPPTGGGAATQSGTNYQNRVAAWVAVHILAEQDASPPWGLPSSTTLDFFRCETLEPVDDVLVGTSVPGHAFLQTKHNIDLGKADDSELASVIDQFVRQYHEHPTLRQRSPWDRPLDAQADRLALVTSPNSSGRIRATLPTVLERIRRLATTQATDDAAVSQDDKEVLSTIRGHISRSWQKLKGAEPKDSDVRALLCFCFGVRSSETLLKLTWHGLVLFNLALDMLPIELAPLATNCRAF